MCHSTPLAPMTEMCFEYLDAIHEESKMEILGLYEGYLKFTHSTSGEEDP